MMGLLSDIATWGLMGLGGFLIFCGGLGLLRFPDFYTRLHAAGVTDTLGAELILIGLMLQATSWIQVVKLILIALFMFMTSPVSTHAIAHAAHIAGLKPRLGPYRAPEPGAPDADEGAPQ
ncbi:MAG: monovalent cation/H(+) antiporter subunit G [Pseudomonadota bacterium]